MHVAGGKIRGEQNPIAIGIHAIKRAQQRRGSIRIQNGCRIDVAAVRLPNARESTGKRRRVTAIECQPINMHVAIRGSVVEGHIHPGISITKVASGTTARAVEQHAESGVVSEVTINIAVVRAGDLERHLQTGDRTDRRRHGFEAGHPDRGAVWNGGANGKIGGHCGLSGEAGSARQQEGENMIRHPKSFCFH